MENKEIHETHPASGYTPDPEVPPTNPTNMHRMPMHKSKWLLLLIVGFLAIFIAAYTIIFLSNKL